MQEINQAVDKTIMDTRGFIQALEVNLPKPPSPELHRKAVAKRKKRKNGGHK